MKYNGPAVLDACAAQVIRSDHFSFM